LSVTLIAAKNSAEKIDPSSSSDSSKQNTLPIETNGDSLPENPRFGHRSLPGSPTHSREPIVSRPVRKRDKGKMSQIQLPLAIVSKGRFDKSEPTIHKGEDLDIPTYIRRGVPLN
jgi:hypothetical protein